MIIKKPNQEGRVKKTVISLAILTMTASAFAAEKAKKAPTCKSGFAKISCEDVKDAKRDFLCWKGEIPADKKEKVCKSKRKQKLKKKK